MLRVTGSLGQALWLMSIASCSVPEEPVRLVYAGREQHAFRLTGRVIDRDRVPMKGWRIYRLGGLVDFTRAPPVIADDLAGDSCIVTDENGEFVLEGLAGIPCRILACDSLSLHSVEGDFDPSRNGHVTLVADRNSSFALDGVLVSRDGTRLPHVDIALALDLREGSSPLSGGLDLGARTASDEDGRFRFEAVPRGERVRLFIGSERVMPCLVPVNELALPRPEIRCERLIHVRLVGLERTDPRWSQIAFGAVDDSGSPVTLVSLRGSGWSFGQMLPASIAQDAAAGVPESARALIFYDAPRGREIRRIELGESAREADVVEVDLAELSAESAGG